MEENGDDWLAPDKFQHVLFCFSIAIISSLLASRAPYPFPRRRSSIKLGSAISLAAGAAKEIADHFGFFNSRGASAKDVVADLLGVLLAVLLLSFYKSLALRTKPDLAVHDRGLEIV